MPEDIEESMPDAENPEWTEERFARALRFEQLPENLQRALTRNTRGPQKSPTKQLVSLRLSVDVLQALRESGPGWQTRVDQILRSQLIKNEAATTSS
jgi:uncharacterized protein (DUF4415 family)